MRLTGWTRAGRKDENYTVGAAIVALCEPALEGRAYAEYAIDECRRPGDWARARLMAGMPVSTEAVLIAAVGTTPELLEIVGRRYVVYLRPRALVSCRFPLVEVHDLRAADASGVRRAIEIPGMLSALPARVGAQAEHWLPTLQCLAEAIDVVGNGGQPQQSVERYRGSFAGISFDSLVWLGAFDREPSAGSNRVVRPGVAVRHEQAVCLTSGGCLGLRVYDGKRHCDLPRPDVSMSGRGLVVDALQMLQREPKPAKRIGANRFERSTVGAANAWPRHRNPAHK